MTPSDLAALEARIRRDAIADCQRALEASGRALDNPVLERFVPHARLRGLHYLEAARVLECLKEPPVQLQLAAVGRAG